MLARRAVLLLTIAFRIAGRSARSGDRARGHAWRRIGARKYPLLAQGHSAFQFIPSL